MTKEKLIVTCPMVILPGLDTPQSAILHIDLVTGKITSISPRLKDWKENSTTQEIVVDDGVVIPGLIDSHVHLNQPGRTAWEGFQTGTRAAISGGVTTLIDMPLNSIPPTTTFENLREKREEASRVGVNCDVGFWGGIIPGNSNELKPLLEEGVKGFKCFLIDSGVDEFPMVTEKDLVQACNALKGTSALILFHAELGETVDHSHADSTSDYSTFLSSRPQSLELDALSLILSLARRYPSLRFHIVHLSAASALPIIRQARSSGVSNLTVETCFHYLTLRSEDIPPSATQYKCCPPIRDEANRKQLIEAVLDGTIDYIVSDHSPCVPELKKGDFMSAWGGVSGLGLGLQLLWTEFGDRLPLGRIANWMGGKQAEQVGLAERKGVLEEGADADFVVFDPNGKTIVTERSLQFKNKVSPYVGRELRGAVKQTYIRGQLVWDASRKSQPPSLGQLL